jgi:Tfp pilus assembly protein PilF
MRQKPMKRAIILSMILILITGCAATFKEKRELSKPRVSIAMGKLQQDDIQGALLELRRAKNDNPKDPEIYYGLALIYWKSDKLEKALENVDEAIKFGDNLEMEHPALKSEAHNLKGNILSSMGSFDQALEAFNAALKDELYTTPEYPLFNMATIYFEMKQYKKAQEKAKQALDYNSHYAPAWELLGRLFIQQGNESQALEALQHAILEFPGYTEAHWELAQIYIRRSFTEKGIFHLQEVVRLDSGGILGAMAEQRLSELKRASKKK